MSVFKVRFHAPMQFLKKTFFEREYSRVTDNSIVLQKTNVSRLALFDLILFLDYHSVEANAN